MRLAQVVPSLESRHGGPSRSVLGLAGGLAALGHEVDLLATEPGAAQTEQPTPGLSVRRFPREWPQSLSASSGLRTYLATQDHDLIHSHGLWLRPMDYARRAAQRQSCPLVISPRGMMSDWAWRHRYWRKLLARLLVHPGALRCTTGWHATSIEEANDIRRLGFRQPLCVAPNGIVVPSEAEMESARNFWHQQYPPLASTRTALFYSRFHPKKRVVELIDLWAQHAPADWLLLLVGIPETYTVAELADYAHRCHIAARVIVHDGTSTPAPYAAASVYLLPSHSENFGLTVAEAMAHGLPVVTTDGTPWHGVEERDCGHCVPWSGFARAMAGLLRESPGQLQERGARARAWMQAEFTWNSSAARLADFYAALARGNA